MSKTFKFDPELWLGNKDLRACSPAARGFWVDVLCLCHPAGYLHINGQPADDTQIARMVGEPVKSVRAWMKELGEAGIFSVDNRGLHSSRMVKEHRFVGQAKAAGARGAVIKKAKQDTPRGQAGMPAGPVQQTTAPAVPEATVEVVPPQRPAPPPAAAPAKKGKALPWYKSPAGWARKASEQGVSLIPDEELDDFKARVAKRLPVGPHLDELSPYHRKEIMQQIEQHAVKEGEKSWAELHGVRS